MATESEEPWEGRETPAWFDEAKLGLFVHWNAAAIPAFAPVTSVHDLPDGIERWERLPYAEMYQNALNLPNSPTARHHAERYGDLPYDAFVAEFRDRMLPAWDPGPLADLCLRSGARYLILTTKTEDGFLLWPSAHPNPRKPRWQSERDVVGDLATSVRERGLRFGTYYSGGIDWTFQGLPVTDHASFLAAMPQSGEYVAYIEAHWRELIQRYRPCSLWNDYCYPAGGDVPGLLRRYLEHVPDGVVNNRFHPLEPNILEPAPIYSDFVTPEYSFEGSPDLKWEACRGLGASFGYNREEREDSYMSSTELIHSFVDIVARGGNLLINVGPTGAGAIPRAQARSLLELGWWLRVNGEALYGSRPWTRTFGVTGDGVGVRFTRTTAGVHAIVLGTPRSTQVELGLGLDEGTRVSLAGRSAPLEWTATAGGVRVQLPEPPAPGPGIALSCAPATGVRPLS